MLLDQNCNWMNWKMNAVGDGIEPV